MTLPELQVKLDGSQPDGTVTLRIADCPPVHVPWRDSIYLGALVESVAAAAAVRAGVDEPTFAALVSHARKAAADVTMQEYGP